MSLKAKIEAVIYASEEPVTLAQLLGLLGGEAQLALDHLNSAQQTIHLQHPEPTLESEPESEPGSEPQPESAPDPAPEPGPSSEASSEPSPEPAATVPDGAPAANLDREKKIARDRDRQLREFMRSTVDSLIADYATSDRGLEVREVAGGYRMATKPEYHDAVRGFVKALKPPLKLTLQALETLAVVAYKQPVTAPEITEIRGVDSGGVLGSLIARKLITTAGRKQVIGRPILYKTTKDFLLRFGLKDVAELPSIEEFEKMAGELAEQEEIDMPQSASEESAEHRITHENLEEEKHATAPQADGDSNSLEADDSDLAPGDTPAVDGRLSGLPPTELQPGEDPSADEAAVQSGEGER